MDNEPKEFTALRKLLERNEAADERARKAQRKAQQREEKANQRIKEVHEKYPRAQFKAEIAAMPIPKRQSSYDGLMDWTLTKLSSHPNNLGLIFLEEVSNRVGRDEFLSYINRILKLDKHKALLPDDIVNIKSAYSADLCDEICKDLKDATKGIPLKVGDLWRRDVLKSFRTASKTGLGLAGAGFIANNVSGHPVVPDGIVPGVALAGMIGVVATKPRYSRNMPLEKIGRAIESRMELLGQASPAR